MLQPTFPRPSRDLTTPHVPDLSLLLQPFPADAVEWKVIESTLYNGSPFVIVAPFLDARSVMERLDAVVGPGGWQTDVKAAPNSLDGVLYGISIKIDGEWVTKWDGADIPADRDGMRADRTKSALTLAHRRAAMLWGIGRYLWSMPKRQRATVSGERTSATPNYHVIKPKARDKWSPMTVYWGAPNLPAWALPEPEAPASAAPRLVSSSSVKAAATVAVSACPKCAGPLTDNRAQNDEKNRLLREAGAAPKNLPDFKCRDLQCQTKLYRSDYDPATGALTEQGREKLLRQLP